LPISVTTIAGGLAGDAAGIGFGNSFSGLALFGPLIDLTGSPGVGANMAFSIPRNGTITAINGYFSTTVAMALVGTTLTMTGQLYRSPLPDNIFFPWPAPV
jgi:BclB C-terminal domain-containing protein